MKGFRNDGGIYNLILLYSQAVCVVPHARCLPIMNRFHTLLRRVVVLMIAAAPSLLAQWVSLGPTGFCSSAAVTNHAIFAGTIGGGMYVSVDHGNNWQDINAGLTSLNVTAIATAGSTVYVATDGGGVLRSTDEGVSWTSIDNYMISSRINAIAAFGDTLVAGPIGYGPFVSADKGNFWYPGGKGLPAATMSYFVKLDSFIYAGTTGNGLYRANLRDSSWVHLDAPLPAKAYISGLTLVGRRLFASCFGYGIFSSSDGGITWTASKTDSIAKITVALTAALRPTGGMRLFAGAPGAGLLISDDTSRTWQVVDLGLISKSVSGFGVLGSTVAAATDDGIFTSTDAGQSWIRPGRGLATSSINSFAFDGPTLVAGSTRQGAFTTTDRGGTWVRNNNGLPSPEVSCLINFGGRIFAGLAVGTIYARDSGAVTWAPSGTGLPGGGYVGFIHSLGISGSTLFAGPGASGAFYSSDRGTNWLPGVGSYVFPAGTVATGFASLEGTAFASTEGLGILRSVNGGKSWTKAFDSLDVTSLSGIVARGGRLIAGASGGPRISDDQGLTWKLSATGMVGIAPTALTVYGNLIFATTSASGLYVSTDNAVTWHAVGQGLPPTAVLAVITDGTDVYVGTALAGIWRRPLSEVLSFPPAPAGEPLAGDGILSQNYPNPFNPSTVIHYRLAADNHVTLTVYDVLGREVALLVNEREDAGAHTVRFDGSGRAAGCYFYRVVAGTQIETRKMLLVK
jgi:hypothetical protein